MALLMLLSVGCGATEETTEPAGESKGYVESDYEIISVDGNSYLRFKKENAYKDYFSKDYCIYTIGEIGFSSFPEMKNSIKNNELSEWDKAIIVRRFDNLENGDVPICDIDNLYIPVGTPSMKIGTLSWMGDSYSVEISDENNSFSGEFLYYTPQAFDQCYAEYKFLWGEGSEHIDSLDSKTLDDGTQVFYYGAISVGDRLYIVKFDGKIYFVSERFGNKYDTSEVDTSLPKEVLILAIDGDNRFAIELYTLTERPSIEFIKSFGIEKFEG